VPQTVKVIGKIKAPELTVDKRSVKTALAAGADVPGCTWSPGHEPPLVAQELRIKPVRNPGYLHWIRSIPCAVCRTRRGIEAAHTGPHGISQKSSDFSAIPLCARHHRTGEDSYHRLGPRRFREVHGLDIPALVARLSAKPRIRVQSGKYVVRIREEEYALGSTEGGLAQAIRRVSDLRRQMAEVA
jgi:hypothetical protein